MCCINNLSDVMGVLASLTHCPDSFKINLSQLEEGLLHAAVTHLDRLTSKPLIQLLRGGCHFKLIVAVCDMKGHFYSDLL